MSFQEPTSGLDYSIASNLITTLKRYSKSKTVIASIHQPSSQMFHMFTNVLLISGGQVKRDYIEQQMMMMSLYLVILRIQMNIDPDYFIIDIFIYQIYHQLTFMYFFFYQTVFFGECSKILEHYEKVGLVCKPQYNPADFISMNNSIQSLLCNVIDYLCIYIQQTLVNRNFFFVSVSGHALFFRLWAVPFISQILHQDYNSNNITIVTITI